MLNFKTYKDQCVTLKSCHHPKLPTCWGKALTAGKELHQLKRRWTHNIQPKSDTVKGWYDRKPTTKTPQLTAKEINKRSRVLSHDQRSDMREGEVNVYIFKNNQLLSVRNCTSTQRGLYRTIFMYDGTFSRLIEGVTWPLYMTLMWWKPKSSTLVITTRLSRAD